MNQRELEEKLRNPQKNRELRRDKKVNAASAFNLTVAGIAAAASLSLTIFFITYSQHKVENISSQLDPEQVKGLVVDQKFTPAAEVRYVQVSEGVDRNAAVRELGTTIPIIARYNYQSFTDKNYEVIGAAPWALLMNVSSNTEDPDLLRYVFNNNSVVRAFVTRPGVNELLESPALLADLAADEEALKTFFEDETVRAVLRSEKLLGVIANSRLMSTLLISKAVKYYRDRPAEAVRLINASPQLRALKANPNVRRAIQHNNYLKAIAPTLLK